MLSARCKARKPEHLAHPLVVPHGRAQPTSEVGQDRSLWYSLSSFCINVLPTLGFKPSQLMGFLKPQDRGGRDDREVSWNRHTSAGEGVSVQIPAKRDSSERALHR